MNHAYPKTINNPNDTSRIALFLSDKLRIGESCITVLFTPLESPAIYGGDARPQRSRPDALALLPARALQWQAGWLARRTG